MPQYFITPAQMRMHLTDIFDHGFSSIALHEQDDDLAQQAIDIAENVGFDGNVLFQYPHPQNPQKLRFRKLSPVFLVSDEIDDHIKHGDGPADSYATNHRTNAGRARALNWQTLSSLGDHRFVRRLQDQNDIGELPNILTLFLNTNKQYFAMSAAEPQERPTRTYYYWHAHMEKPNLHRVLAGLYLWKSKADGITPYCYQHPPVFPFSPYNDFDEWCPAYQHGGVNRPFRDQMVAYPARDGIVSTIQWEAMRDGITDLRYLTTLQDLIERAATAGDEQAEHLADTAQKRVENFLSKLPLHKIEVNHERNSEPFEEVQPREYHQFRMQMQESILELQALLPQSSISSIDVRPSAPRIDIVIPAKNEEKHLGRLLSALSRQTYPSDLVSIRVVDNGSTDGTANIARANGASVLSAEGFVGAVRNAGIRAGNAELIGLLDADCVPVQHWIASMVQTFARPQIGVCAGSLQNICQNKLVKMFADRSIFASWEMMSKCTVRGESSPYPWAMLGNAMIRRKAVEQAGMFDESLFRNEDVDLTVRLVQMGYQIACAPQASVQHFETDSPAKYLLKHARYGAGGARIAAKLGISGMPKFKEFDRSTAGRALQYLYLAGYWIERGKIATTPHRTSAQQFSTARALPEFRQPFAWDNERILALSDHMVFWHSTDKVVAVDMQDSRRFVFDGCAAGVIFDCLSDGLSRQETLHRLVEEFDCAPQEAASDLDEFVQQLIQQNLLNLNLNLNQSQHAQILVQSCR
jgi:GT2 family glycosyltransferase